MIKYFDAKLLNDTITQRTEKEEKEMLTLTHRNALVISKEWKEIKDMSMFNAVFSKLNFAKKKKNVL